MRFTPIPLQTFTHIPALVRLLRMGGFVLTGWLLLVAPSWAVTFNTLLSDVNWQVDQSIFECKLSQPVAGFGQAAFSRRAGEPEVFYLQQKQILLPAGKATIGLGQPSWQQPGIMPKPLVEARVVAEPIPLRVENSLVETLQSELLKG